MQESLISDFIIQCLALSFNNNASQVRREARQPRHNDQEKEPIEIKQIWLTPKFDVLLLFLNLAQTIAWELVPCQNSIPGRVGTRRPTNNLGCRNGILVWMVAYYGWQ